MNSHLVPFPFFPSRKYGITPPKKEEEKKGGGDAKVKLVGLRPAENWRGVNCPHEALRAALFFLGREGGRLTFPNIQF